MRSLLYYIIFIVAFHASGSAFGQETDLTKGVAATEATIYETETEVCLGDSVAAYLIMDGKEDPWDVVINNNSGEYLVLEDIGTPYTIWLKPETNDRYYIASVVDRRGNEGTTEGEVAVSVYETTPVSIQLDRTAYLHSEPGVVLVSTPSWGIFSGIGVAGNAFYPQIATPVGSPHTITCTVTNTYGCISSDNIDIHVLYGESEVFLLLGDEPITTLCDDGETYVIRGSNQDNIPGLFELREAGSPDLLPGHISDDDLLDDMAILDPAGLAGSYDIIYIYTFQDLTISVSYPFNVSDLGILGILDLPNVVCKNDDPYPLLPEVLENDPGALYVFSGPGVSGNQAEGYFYDPGAPDATVGENQITLEYNSPNGCSFSLTRVVTNSFTPDVRFSFTPLCLPEDGGLVTFNNLTIGKDEVSNWSWDFGDPSSGTNNYSNLGDPIHFYSEAGPRQISLTATTTAGCVVNQSMDTVLADKPLVDFSWINDCFVEGQKVAFVDRSNSTFSSLDTFIWTFKTTEGEVLGVVESNSSTDTVEFSVTGAGTYHMDLQVINGVGCEGVRTKEIVLSPTRVLTSEAHVVDFNGTETDWISGSVGENLSWIRDVPDFAGFNQEPGDKAWFTNLPPDNKGYLEHSWIQSACFDFSSMKNPVIKMDLMKSFKPGTDGVVLQYQDVVSEGWKTIGNLGEGINWLK